VYTYDQQAWICSEFGPCPKCTGIPISDRLPDFLNLLKKTMQDSRPNAQTTLWWKPWELSKGQTIDIVKKIDPKGFGLMLNSSTSNEVYPFNDGSLKSDLGVKRLVQYAYEKNIPVVGEFDHTLYKPLYGVDDYFPRLVYEQMTGWKELTGVIGVKEYYGFAPSTYSVNYSMLKAWMKAPDASLDQLLQQIAAPYGKKSAALTRAKRLLAQKRTKRLLRHWVLRKRHKEESAWKRTMAASQDKLRLFRLLMSVCAQRLHYRRTKEYAAETYHSHFLIQVFEGWRIAIRRKTEIREISKRELGEKSRKVFDAWKLLSRKSHLYEELQKKGRKVRLKWLKIAVLRGLKLYLEMNMGAIAKRRLILQRRQELQATWALQCWKKGITRHKADREKHKFLKSRRNKRVLQKAVREWTSKLQQKAAKRTIKERKTTQTRIIVQKLVLRQCYEKWQNYHLKRRRILGKYDLADRIFIRQNMRKFYSKLRLYHRNFRYLQGKLDLADSHSQVSLLRKALIGLRSNITQRSKNKEKLGVALHYWAERRYKMSLEGLMQYRASRRWKGKMEEIALEMRRGDLVSSALGRVQRVGTEWKQERLKVATKARVQKEQRAWKLVAKFAQRWKAKTIQRRKMREIEAIARQKASLLPTKRRASAKEQSVCLQQDGTQARCRPQPRRPAFLSSKPALSFPERPVSPSPSLSIAPPRVLPQSPTSRLEAIEAELMGFKFEKEKVVKYESYVHANPGNTELKAQLGKMKDRLNDRKPRVKALLEEVDRLKSLA